MLEALTLIAALGFERTASSTEDAEATQRGDAAVASGWELSAEQALTLSEDHSEPAPVPVRAPGARLGLAAFLLTEATAAPQPGWNYGLGASAHWDGAGWQPWVLFGIYAGGGERARVPDAAAIARFERLSTYAVGCPVRFPRSAPIALRPCIDLDLGRLTGEGLDVSRARRRSALWASTGLELRLEWSPWPELALSGMLGGVLPLSRPRFYFRPELTTLEVAPIGLRAGALANLSF